MKPDAKDLEALKVKVKEAFLEEVKRRGVERLLNDNKDRIERYLAQLSHDLAEDVSKEFPL